MTSNVTAPLGTFPSGELLRAVVQQDQGPSTFHGSTLRLKAMTY